MTSKNQVIFPQRHWIEVADKAILDFPCFEKLRFMNSGMEVIQIALQFARAYTKKTSSESSKVPFTAFLRVSRTVSIHL